MREKQIVHRDLKLANILLTNDFVIKLADFGFAKFAENNILLQSYCGTPITMAPEILKRKQYNEKCDIWSLGIIIYKMLFGDYPFFPQTYSLDDLIETIMKGDLKFPGEINVIF
jgi:serine/threonine-protein kinase ULK/ATG1